VGALNELTPLRDWPAMFASPLKSKSRIEAEKRRTSASTDRAAAEGEGRCSSGDRLF
jgi:hypothetical protein